MSDLDELVAEIPRGDGRALRIRRCTYRGSRPYVDARDWYRNDSTGELLPGKGVTFRERELPEVIRALIQIEKATRGDAPARSSARQQRTTPDNSGQVDRHRGGVATPTATDADLAEDERLF